MATYTATNNPLTLTVNEDIFIVPVFEVLPAVTPTPTPTPTPSVSRPQQQIYTVVVSANPLAGGTVRGSSDLGTTPLTAYAQSVTISYLLGEAVRVSARANAGYQFVRWDLNGNPWSENVDAGFLSPDVRTLTAIFELIQQVTPTPTASPTPSVTPSRQFIPPTPTPSRTNTPIPSITPSRGVSGTPVPTTTPGPSRTPAVTPSPSPIFWKSCIDGKLYPGTPPGDYRQGVYQGASGGTCWEPTTQVGFSPNLNNLEFIYQRGSGVFPKPLSFTAQNPSYSLSYQVRFTTNNTFFVVDPPLLSLPPRGQQKFTVSIKSDTINQIDDGKTGFGLEVEITQV